MKKYYPQWNKKTVKSKHPENFLLWWQPRRYGLQKDLGFCPNYFFLCLHLVQKYPSQIAWSFILTDPIYLGLFWEQRFTEWFSHLLMIYRPNMWTQHSKVSCPKTEIIIRSWQTWVIIYLTKSLAKEVCSVNKLLLSIFFLHFFNYTR